MITTNFNNWNPHAVEDRQEKYLSMSAEEAIQDVLTENPQGLTRFQIAQKIAVTTHRYGSDSISIAIINTVNRVLYSHEFLHDGEKWFAKLDNLQNANKSS